MTNTLSTTTGDKVLSVQRGLDGTVETRVNDEVISDGDEFAHLEAALAKVWVFETENEKAVYNLVWGIPSPNTPFVPQAAIQAVTRWMDPGESDFENDRRLIEQAIELWEAPQ